jgi:pyruvate ferredoxin oxidoreductase alpha subunit
MSNETVTWRIAGGSGDGIDSTSRNFATVLMRKGYNLFTHRHYPSRIRGGHTFAEIRIGSDPVTCRGDAYDILLALGDSFARNESEDAYYGTEEVKPLTENLDDLREGGLIIYDDGQISPEKLPDNFEKDVEENDWTVLNVGLKEIAREYGRAIMRNTAGVGVSAAIMGVETEEISNILSESMSGEVLENNERVLEEAHQIGKDSDYEMDMPDTNDFEDTQVLLNGDDAVSYGAVDEGVQFISGYPMTPWTGVFSRLSQIIPQNGGVAEQVEDEIAACSMAVGASYAGAKAITGSSGGGLALMSEPLGMAEMTETPIVLIEAQRGGPSTGLPTKPEQSDLEHVLYTSQGDSLRFVVAPGNIREAYEQTRLAFDVAYEYQLPGIVMTDQKISGELRNVNESFFDRETNIGDIGSVLTEDEISDAPHHSSGRYNRFRYSEDLEGNVSPRTLPGQEDGSYLSTGNEHNVQGHISEDPTNRQKQMDRRVAKLKDVANELDESDYTLQTYFGDENSDVGIITFGSQQGTVREGVRRSEENGFSTYALGVSQLKPFPTEEVQEFLDGLNDCIVVEMNATGQFENELRKHVELRRRPQDIGLHSLKRFDGNPIRPKQIEDKIKKVINNDR